MVALLSVVLLGCNGQGTDTDSGTSVTDTPSPDSGTTDSRPPTDSGHTTDTGDTQDPIDADGDGWFTPDDCDDKNPYTFPGAEEWCDPQDHDCDGEPLEEGVCAKPQKVEAIEGPWIDGDPWEDLAYWGVFAGDLDGEPGDELLAKTWYSFDDGVSWYGALAVVSAPVAEPGTRITDQADHIFARSWGGMGEWQGAGDFNGDGAADFIVLEGAAGVAGIINLFLGPSSDWPAVAFTYEAASVVWEDPDPTKTESLGDFVDGQGDINGDGYSELLIEGNNDDYQNVLIMGRADTPAGGDTLLEETLNTVRDGRDYALGPDLDGDGLHDILGMNNGFEVILGQDIPIGEATVWRDFGRHVAKDGAANCQLMNDHDDALLDAGDFTGDGIADIGFHCDEDLGTANGEDPALYLIDGAALASSEEGGFLMDIAYGPWLMIHAEEETNVSALPLSDIDGDDEDDLWTEACGGRYDETGCRYYFYLSTGGVPGPYTQPDPSGYALNLTHGFNASGAAAFMTSSGDMDGDGFPELALYHGYDLDTDPQVAIRVIPGWDIPWDDPFYW